MPILTTLHTILDTPSKGQQSVMNEIANLSERIISISQRGVDMLTQIYGIPVQKCVHIHHGVHEYTQHDLSKKIARLGLTGNKILLTFGLLSPNKSIEVVINALPSVIEKNPNVVYIVLGATHPHVLKHNGEEYRHSLIQLVNKLGLEKHVMFIDRFVSNDELFDFLHLCDIYIIPYLGEKQISSGTLIYAMGAGKPVVSTPFWYAQEMLDEGRGMLFPFSDSKQLAAHITHLLEHQDERIQMGQKAYDYALQCRWPNIGKQYAKLAERILANNSEQITKSSPLPYVEPAFPLPPINLKHLRVLTDDTGILQHACYTVPNRKHGYCLDDNARALLLCVMLQNEVQDLDTLYQLTSIYLSFIADAYNPNNGKFRNFMAYNRNWLEEEGSEDSLGRTMWALGYMTANTDVKQFHLLANELFFKALQLQNDIRHPRSLAYYILGLVFFSRIHQVPEVMQVMRNKAQQLSALFDRTIDKEWIWHDEKLSYDNCRIAHALINAGSCLHDEELTNRGIKILDWLINKQFDENIFIPIGNRGWMSPHEEALFDQQPLEAFGMIEACLVAERHTHDEKYGKYALKAFAWYTGNNISSTELYDFATGGCMDGLGANGSNLNEGAESTLSWLMSLVRILHYLQDEYK